MAAFHAVAHVEEPSASARVRKPGRTGVAIAREQRGAVRIRARDQDVSTPHTSVARRARHQPW